VPGERSGGYSIGHTGVIYLMGRNGEYLGFMPPQIGPDKLTEVLRKYLAEQLLCADSGERTSRGGWLSLTSGAIV
jgi:hypothetical protein